MPGPESAQTGMQACLGKLRLRILVGTLVLVLEMPRSDALLPPLCEELARRDREDPADLPPSKGEVAPRHQEGHRDHDRREQEGKERNGKDNARQDEASRQSVIVPVVVGGNDPHAVVARKEERQLEADHGEFLDLEEAWQLHEPVVGDGLLLRADHIPLAPRQLYHLNLLLEPVPRHVDWNAESEHERGNRNGGDDDNMNWVPLGQAHCHSGHEESECDRKPRGKLDLDEVHHQAAEHCGGEQLEREPIVQLVGRVVPVEGFCVSQLLV
mmetsp:Transcript_86141/g.257069  ORF Transcript_86141/g.257069 Transcript_86141/m.257069 type:complete len:270 (+) Transcript_86141:72-881(+)